jgi:hypothetical protein
MTGEPGVLKLMNLSKKAKPATEAHREARKCCPSVLEDKRLLREIRLNVLYLLIQPRKCFAK